MKDKLLDTEKGRLKLRAAARAKLSDPNRPPSFAVLFVSPGPRDENGILTEIEVDSKYAQMSGGNLAEKGGDRGC